MRAITAKAIGGVLLSLVFAAGCAYIAFDFIARRSIVWMGVVWAFASAVATVALVLKIITLRRMIKRRP